MRPPFVRPLLCGALPLAVGVGIWGWWRLTRIDALMFAGVITIPVGVIATLMGAGWWIVDAICFARDRALRSTKMAGRAALALVLLVGCYPAAGAIVLDVQHVTTSYFVEIANDSDQSLTSCRVFGGGFDEDLGPVAPGESAETTFRVAHDDSLRCTIRVGEISHDVVLDGYVTNGMGGSARVTVGADGIPTVRGRSR